MERPRASAFAVYQRRSLKVSGFSKRKATEQRRRGKKKQKLKKVIELEFCLAPGRAGIPGPELSPKAEQAQVPIPILNTHVEPVRKVNRKPTSGKLKHSPLKNFSPGHTEVPRRKPSFKDEAEEANISIPVWNGEAEPVQKVNKKATSGKLESALLKNVALEPKVAVTPERKGYKLKKSPGNTMQHVGPSLESVFQGLETIPNSRERAAKLFEWMISPISPRRFFSEFWEKRPALIKRHNLDFYEGLFSTDEFDRILRENSVQFGVNLDVTSYTDGKRETHNPPGRALPFVVWDYYKNGCSLRMLNPQAFSVTMWRFLSVLQEQFGSMCGANTYLTPPGTQGFAPHYDDIEAFVIQLEGKKHWRVYKPRQSSEILPQFSSPNFRQEEIGEPILDTVLEAGDLLYFPRGFIHQGDCFPAAHSLHITVSSYQKNSWADLLGKLLVAGLQVAVEEDVEYREGLPLDYLEYMGVQNSDQADPRRTDFMLKVQKLIKKLAELAPVDAAVDQKAKDFMHDCLPPVLTAAEHSHSVHGASARWENGAVQDVGMQMGRGTRVRLLRNGIVRLCSETECCRMYYTTDNSRVYHKEELKYIELDIEDAEGIEFLIHSYPKYVSVDNLPGETLNDKITLATLLFEKGLLTTKKPLHVA